VRHVISTQICLALEGQRWSVLSWTQVWMLAENRALANDMAEAERLSGRNPRGALSREIPL